MISFNRSNPFKDPVSKYTHTVSQVREVRTLMCELEGDTVQPLTELSDVAQGREASPGTDQVLTWKDASPGPTSDLGRRTFPIEDWEPEC